MQTHYSIIEIKSGKNFLKISKLSATISTKLEKAI